MGGKSCDIFEIQAFICKNPRVYEDDLMGKYKKLFEELLDIDERFPDDMKDGLRFLYDGYHRKGGYEWEDPKVGYQVTVPKHLQHTALKGYRRLFWYSMGYRR